MISQTPNQENTIFFYVCHNKHLFKKVEPNFFKNPYLAKLFALTKNYHHKYSGDLPFKLDNPNVEQIRMIVEAQPDKFLIDPTLEKEQNVKAFISNVENILRTEYSRFDPKWVKKTSESVIKWRALELSFQRAIDYIKTQKVDESNVDEVISYAKNIVNDGSGIVIDDKISKNFLDAAAHKQIDPENLINSGWHNLNKWLSGKAGGGFEPGTLTLFIGESNIGKSIWLGNLAYNIFLNGKNVLFISLEMSVEKIYKRIGANAFGVDINSYAEFSASAAYVEEKIKDFKDKCSSDMIPLGTLAAEKFTSATPKDIQSFAKAEAKRLGIKWHAIVIDYLTELDNAHGINQADMYMYHKTNTNDLYNMSGDDDVAVISAHQIKGGDFGAEDLTLSSLGESRGIVHRTDNIYGIIQTPDHKLQKKYYLKNIKSRDGEYKGYKIPFDIRYDRMILTENENMIEPSEMMISSH